MGRLFGEANPEFVLFGAFGCGESPEGGREEERDNRELDVGEVGQTLEHERVVVVDVLPFVLVYLDFNRGIFLFQLCDFAGVEFFDILFRLFEVARRDVAVVLVGYDDGDVFVVFYYLEYEVVVFVVKHTVGGLGPYLHLAPFLF